jgi:hypothetical protein
LEIAIDRNRRREEERNVRYLNEEGDYAVEVEHTLNKWCVTVLQLPERKIIAQDFFPERWKALARAQDFVRILNMRHREEEGVPADDD